MLSFGFVFCPFNEYTNWDGGSCLVVWLSDYVCIISSFHCFVLLGGGKLLCSTTEYHHYTIYFLQHVYFPDTGYHQNETTQ